MSMDSPFPRLSSGQSLSASDQCSPRDFGTVPHTPKIPDQWRTYDQSVPRTPDSPLAWRGGGRGGGGDGDGGRGVEGGRGEGVEWQPPPLPLLATPLAPRWMTERQAVDGGRNIPHCADTPLVSSCPDQEVPATPVGGFIPAFAVTSSPVPFLDSPAPFLARHTQCLDSHTPRGSYMGRRVSLFSSPFRNTSTAVHIPQTGHTSGLLVQQQQQHRTPEMTSMPSRSRAISCHVRQTPSLSSSRRRLSLEPLATSSALSNRQQLAPPVDLMNDESTVLLLPTAGPISRPTPHYVHQPLSPESVPHNHPTNRPDNNKHQCYTFNSRSQQSLNARREVLLSETTDDDDDDDDEEDLVNLDDAEERQGDHYESESDLSPCPLPSRGAVGGGGGGSVPMPHITSRHLLHAQYTTSPHHVVGDCVHSSATTTTRVTPNRCSINNDIIASSTPDQSPGVLEFDATDRKAEVERRVRRVLDGKHTENNNNTTSNTHGHGPHCQSVLSLFDDDDIFP